MSSKTKQETKQESKQNMKPKGMADNAVKRKSADKKRYLKYFLVLVAIGIIGLVIAIVKFYGNDYIKRNASTTIEFTYDGAAHNLTPTGEQFSISGITDDKIINRALENIGLSEKYGVQDIVQNIKVNASYPQDVIDKIKDYNSLYDFTGSRAVSVDDYFPTVFQLQLFDDFDTSISDSDLKAIVNAISEEYKQEFIQKYIFSFDKDSISSLLDLSSYDYVQRVKILKLRVSTLSKYASEMFAQNIAFMYKGLSFNDFVLKCKMLENDSLSNIEATVMTDVLTTSVSRLRNQYEYEIRLLENELEFKNTNLEEINSLINTYKMDGRLYIGSGDSLVLVEGNSKETYEKLIDEKREISDRIVEINSEIERYKLYISDLKSATFSSSARTSVSEKINAVNEKINELSTSFMDMMTAYNNTIINEAEVIVGSARYQGADLLSGSFVVMAVKCIAPLCIVAMVILSINALIIEVKREKRKRVMNL